MAGNGAGVGVHVALDIRAIGDQRANAQAANQVCETVRIQGVLELVILHPSTAYNM